MKTVSNGFTTAFASGSMEVKTKLVAEFGSNRFNDAQVCTASSEKLIRRNVDGTIQLPTFQFWTPASAFNNKNRNSMRWAVCGDRNNPGKGAKAAGASSSYAPYRVVPREPKELETGWRSNTKSDASGLFASPEWVMSMFNSRPINKIKLYGMEGYPNIKTISVQYHDIDLNSWVNVATNYVCAENDYQHEWTVSPNKNCDGLRVYIYSTYATDDQARVSELQGLLVEDISSDVISCDINEVRQDYETSVPLGTTRANTLNAQLDNTDQKYSRSNSSSPYYPYIEPHTRIEAFYGINVGSNTYEYTPMGEFWVDEWNGDGGSTVAQFGARDFSMFLQSETLEIPRLWRNQTVKRIIQDVMARMGKCSDELDIDTNALREIPLLYLYEASPWTFLTEVAFADQGMFGFDESGLFYYHSYNRLNEAPYTSVVKDFSDNDYIIDISENSAIYANKVIVDVSPVNTERTGVKSLWSAEQPTVLRYTQLGANISSTDTTITVKVSETDSAWTTQLKGLAPSAWFRLGETSGSQALNEKPSGNGTYVGSPLLNQTGLVLYDSNKSVQFDGTDDRISTTTGLITSSDCSFGMWIKTSVAGTPTFYRMLYAQGPNGNRNQIFFGINNEGKLYLALYNQSAVLQVSALTTTAITDGNLHFVGFSSVGGNNTTATIYIDGVASATATGGLWSPAGSATSSICGPNDGSVNGYFSGGADEVVIFNNKKLSSEFKTLDTAGRSNNSIKDWPKGPNLIWFPTFDVNGKVTGGEVIKYETRTGLAFTNCKRGYLDTQAVSHTSGKYIYEAREFDVKYDTSPATDVKWPLVSAIDSLKTEPGEGTPQAHVISYKRSPFAAQLAIGNIVKYLTILQGQGRSEKTNDPDLEWSTLIAGTVAIENFGKEKITDADLSAENIDLRRRYGKQEVRLSNNWIQTREHAQNIAAVIIDEYKTPRDILQMRAIGLPMLETGDRIRIVNYPALSIVNKEYHIIGISFSYDGGLEATYTLRKCKP